MTLTLVGIKFECHTHYKAPSVYYTITWLGVVKPTNVGLCYMMWSEMV